jgi:soluble lytic murein transglycosylase-like protein
MPEGADYFEIVNQYISEAAAEHNVPESLIAGLVHAESSFRPDIVSPRGAVGLMQLMPDTAKAMGVEDPYDPKQNIMGGTKYLRTLLDRFKGDERMALAAYNHGPTAISKLGRVPRRKSTLQYIDKIQRKAKNPDRLREIYKKSATPIPKSEESGGTLMSN